MSVYKNLLCILILLLTSCSVDIDEYKSATPKFDLFGYFKGKTQAWGMIQDYSGKQMRRFTVSLEGAIKDDKLTLVEDFIFDDGKTTQRIWIITQQQDGSYIGKADDIIGVAIGKEQGNALHWQYDFQLELDDSNVKVTFDDWLYRQDEKRVFNLTKIKKLGVEVGQITLFFEKL
ncbi:DUF3833 domain-containing protein [Vibrio sp. SS-MA-C1-2]|uniref:DUF3833 domain-containing protein n=1 Tax=Vibrio sp. SS-MA-C1-2 TaxID=2908646 RepID=UPI001F3BF69A|nr:DUF3833 domain-containing protein [Vibrio sp. SS-MA-C1-2]UJF17795.1 DUF3833 domain-containing protein [Vibrio sp. SS-MA-C1-2]